MRTARKFLRERERRALKKRRAALMDHYSYLVELTAADDSEFIRSHSAPLMGDTWSDIREIDARLRKLDQED